MFVGDTLRCESECIEVRESKSRPNAGIVTWEHRSFNQRDELVCEMHPLRAAPEEAAMSREPRAAGCSFRRTASKKIAKALDSEADAIIFDLEDSVAPAQKAAARDILKAFPNAATAGPQWWVRINPHRHASSTRTTSSCSAVARHPRHRPAQGGKRRRRRPSSRTRTGNMPIHAIVTETAASLFGLLSYRDCWLAAGGDELGRRGSVGGARRVVQI